MDLASETQCICEGPLLCAENDGTPLKSGMVLNSGSVIWMLFYVFFLLYGGEKNDRGQMFMIGVFLD
jgi:hypothetical protein